MSNKDIDNIINKELINHPHEDRELIKRMMLDKIEGITTSRNDYKKLLKDRKKIRKANIKKDNDLS